MESENDEICRCFSLLIIGMIAIVLCFGYQSKKVKNTFGQKAQITQRG